MISAGSIRDLNNRYGASLPKVLTCPNGHGDYSADLALYHATRDAQTFGCPDCDADLWLQFRGPSNRRLAQRFAA
jgi:hypothetical protein